MKTCRLVAVAAVTASVFASAASAEPAQDTEAPPFNLQVKLRAVDGGQGSGRVKFRQPKDAAKIVFLRTRVRNLAPNHSYLLQRAVDTTVDDNCTSTAWLTLGRGLDPQAITTDDRGRGRELLFRDLSAVPTGSQFDIHFRVIDAVTSAPVLQSDCYQYTVRGVDLAPTDDDEGHDEDDDD